MFIFTNCLIFYKTHSNFNKDIKKKSLILLPHLEITILLKNKPCAETGKEMKQNFNFEET